MSGAMRKMGVYLGLLEDTEGDYAELDQVEAATYDEQTSHVPGTGGAEPAPRRRDRSSRPVASIADRRRGAPAAEPPSAEPAPVRAVAPLSRITTLHPRTYNDARAIGENFRDGIPVIMNLSELADADAKRLVDFAAGLVFATRGGIERVTSKVFLLSPPHVEISAEEKQNVVEGEFFNQS